MPQKTNLNVAPYFDDFATGDNFQQVLFRPGFAVQARELTTLQSILQNQSETSNRHLFKEGAMVVPGQISSKRIDALKLQNQFSAEDVDTSQYVGKVITGATTGVKAKVITHAASTGDDPPTLFIQYISAGTDNVTTEFANNENISANGGITHTTVYSSDVASATTATASSGAVGLMANIQSGIYFIRGNFVEVAETDLILSKYTTDFTGRVGLTITETLTTPETDTSLLDNSTGSSNFAAKGAHRLTITAALSTLSSTSTADDNFVELMRIDRGTVKEKVRDTEFGTIEDTFARRTFDESGDYTVRPFLFEMKESVTVNENEGVFAEGATTDDGNTASSSLLTLKMSPGKAYVKGYEIEKIAPTFKDIKKARDFNTINAGITVFDVGNFVNISNVYNTPDIEFVSGESTAHKQLELFDTPTTTRGSSSGTMIGVARARTIQYSTGTVGLPEAVYRLYLFDIRPFTFLTLSGTPSPNLEANNSGGGVLVTGETSGATGFVFADGTGGTKVVLTNVVGTFSSGEKITASDSVETDKIVENSGDTDLTISNIKTNTFEDVRQIFMDDNDSGQDFSADIVLDTQNTDASFLVLDGTDANQSDADNLLRMEDGSTTATSLGDNAAIEKAAAAGTGSAKKIAKLQFAEKNISLFKLNKRQIKTHLTTKNNGVSDTQFTIRRQYVVTSSAAGVVTISAGSSETFLSHSEVDYTMSVLTAGAGGSAVQGDVVSCATGFSGGGTSTVSVTNVAALGNAAKVKIVATLLKTSITAKAKTANLMKQVKVVSGATDAYGTRPTDKEISLGRADVFKMVAVYDSEDTSTDAVAPTMTVGTQSGIFTRGEKITGGTSAATGRIVNISSPLSFVSTNSKSFQVGDVITGESSKATATITALTTGDSNITNRFLLDTGQRDNFYDIARINRKPDSQKPLGRLLIIHDYMEHGAGDVFTVDSYTDVANQMDYEDIPQYNATKVDPDQPAPTGVYPLQDVFDARPRVEDIAGTSTSVDAVDEITGNSFDFFHRQWDGTGSSTVHVMKPGSNIQSDFEYFLPYKAFIHMNKDGELVITEGVSAETPEFPKEPDGMMRLGSINVPAFTFKPKDVFVKKEKNQRYTMADIGKLEDRIDNVEYYTALSLLERDAESFEVQDSNGLNRFKSGFVVDNFGGHRVGDVLHPDYKNSMDMENKELRPQHFMKGLFLEESVSTDADRATAGYKKTGDLITLPYSEETLIDQPYSTRLERVTPVLVSNWIGSINLTPATDEWFETETAPDLIVNVEGNFDTFFAANRNQIGTVWNSWQTQWSGQGTVRQVEDPSGTVVRTIETVRQGLRRSGIQTTIQEKIDLESQGTRVIARAVIPFCRSRNIVFEGTGFYPNTRVFAFFDKRAVSKHCTPAIGFSTNDSSIVQGSAMVTTAAGKIKGTFLLPDPKVAGNERFQTGEIQFRLTSSETNITSIDPVTAGDVIYFAKGILETEQETILSIRNAELVRTSVSQNTVQTRSRVVAQRVVEENDGGDPGNDDPLFQTFLIDETDVTKGQEGVFVTSIDLFHGEKDENIPVTIEIRNVINGYPGPKIMPFSRVVKEPADIATSEDATVATTYNFSSPVFLRNNTEYGVAVITSVPTHKVWISRMGETETGGTRQVSKQPELGVLFKGHNNRTWAPSLTEDLKFKLKKAKFTTGTSGGIVTLQNSTLPLKTLEPNPLIFTNGSTTLRVNHRNHHMYSTSNNVTIDGVKSGASTTLNGAISSDATTMTLASATDFDDTSGKFSNNASSEWFVKIDDEIMKYTAVSGNTVSTITRAQNGTLAATHADGATVELYMLHKVVFSEINKTHTSISNIGMDSYTLTLTTAPTIVGDSTTAQNGGSVVTASENALFDVAQSMIGTMILKDTDISVSLRPTTGTSPSGTESSFVRTLEADELSISLGENIYLDDASIVCSGINETNELGGNKSLQLPVKLTSTKSNLSPVIDTQRMSFISIANRLDKIDSSSDIFPTADFVASTEPQGDNNSAIYMTKKVTLENPATSLRVLFSAYRHSSAEVEVMFKILRSDDASDFDDLGWTYFNTDGSPDSSVNSSLTRDDFQEYEYTAGIKDDGSGTALAPFISFSIKCIMKGSRSCEAPRIRDFRAIALAT